MGINWLGVLQPQDESLPAQPGGCAQCHVGLGAKPNLPPTDADLANVDCLICHGPDYSRTVVKDETGKAHLVPTQGMDVVAVAQNAQRPTSEMCTRCHLKAAGGPNFKHGDYPTSAESDVHMAAGIQCVDCHKTQAHKIAGGGYMIAQELPDVIVACSNCHTEAPHIGEKADMLNTHTARVACQTCHIPLVARDLNYPTQMTRDYTQPVYNAKTGLYGPKLGKATNLVPTYFWWNNHLMETPPKPVGSAGDPDAKITPWKSLEVTVPFDVATHTPIYIKQGTYKIKGDLNAAVDAGVGASGQEYSGSWEAVTELMYFDANHQVAPASESLTCVGCHTPDGVLDFVVLGYQEEKAQTLQTLMIVEGEFTMSLAQGLNMLSLPLKPKTPYTARSFAEKLEATVVIKLDEQRGRFVGFTVDSSGDGFAIEGGKGYIVNLKTATDVTFEGTMWTNAPAKTTPTNSIKPTWAFVVSGFVHEKGIAASADKYTAIVSNLRTGNVAADIVSVSGDGQFTAVWADLTRKSVVEVGDKLKILVKDYTGEIVSGPIVHQIDVDDIKRAFTSVTLELGDVIPAKSMLAQNYPNPFNPDTWIPYQLAKDAEVTIKIYSATGQLVRTMNLGYKNAGLYMSQDKTAYWNGKNDNGEPVASGVYLYSIQAGDFTGSKKMVIAK